VTAADPIVTYGIAEAGNNLWDVQEYHDGILYRTIAAGVLKDSAERIRDEHIAARDETP
jgi:hypothetical protein